MLWRLALQCNKPHPDFLPPLTPHQLAEAQAFYLIEPWGPERDSWHAAQITAAVVQQWSKSRVNMSDYVLKFGEPGARPQPNLSDKLKSVARAIGARIVKREG